VHANKATQLTEGEAEGISHPPAWEVPAAAGVRPGRIDECSHGDARGGTDWPDRYSAHRRS
jgi:hypothetical protein